MGLYNKKGIYAGYDKNNKEREALDYYATPPEEVCNILEILKRDNENFRILPENESVLEPCCGGGHMVEGILRYNPKFNLVATDIKERTSIWKEEHEKLDISTKYFSGSEFDFLSDDYPVKETGTVIMNPPFSVAAPFILHALDIAQNFVIVFGRTKLVETKGRYNDIFANFPPTIIYQYIDRVACAKNGDFENTSAIEAHAWFIWDKKVMEKDYNTIFKWMWRIK